MKNRNNATTINKETANNDQIKTTSLMNKTIDIISGIFIPIINVLMGAAILKGVLILIASLGLMSETSGVYQVLFAIADGLFYYLPVLLAYTSAVKLKADPFTALVIAFALLHPDITKLIENGIGIELFGMQIKQVTYPSSVIPIILAIALLHYVEIPLEKYLPKVLKGFLKPMIAVIIVTPITFLVFGPLGTYVGDALANAYSVLYNFSPIFAGVIFGFIIQPLVVFGLHWGLVPVIINNIAVYGADTILPLIGPAAFAQAGTALAVGLLAKNKKLKSVAISGSITALLGVTEPVLYGVSLPLKRPMIAACIAGAIGGGIVGTSQAGAVSLAFPSLVTLVVYFGEGFWTFLSACILGFLIAFALTYVLRFKEKEI